MKIEIKNKSTSIVITMDDDNYEITSEQVVKKANSIGEYRKSQALQFLKEKCEDTTENIKLINDVVYTDTAIVIGGVSWSYNNAKVSDFGLQYTKDDTNNKADYKQAHVFKGENTPKGDFSNEDYFTRAMVDKITKEQQAKVPSYQDIWNTLVSLPGDTTGKSPKKPTYVQWGIGVKILSILLGTEMSGYRCGGEREYCGSYGYLWSRSESDSDYAWACKWVESEGRLDDCLRGYARPLRLLV